MQFTDGAWTEYDPLKEQYIIEAGYGVAEFEACSESEPGALPMGQLVRAAPTQAAHTLGTDRRCEHTKHARLRAAYRGEVSVPDKDKPPL